MIQKVVSVLAYTLGPVAVLGYLSHRFYFAGGRCKSKKRLDGKITIVTGANCGIGYETALDFARRGAHVIMACRNIKRSQPAADKIKLETNNNNVEVEILDLSSLKSVRDFADRIKKRFKRIDILVNNAGLTVHSRQQTVDGFETTFAVNHLGPFLLTNLLLDVIKNSGASRIVNVSSMVQRSAIIDWDDLQSTKDFNTFKAYKQTKLANVLITKLLAKKLEGTNVLTASLHPGVVRTEIWRTDMQSFLFRLLTALFYPLIVTLTKDCEEGAQTTLFCALDDEEVPKHNGEYFSDCRWVATPKADIQSAERLWKISAEMVGLAN